MDFAPPATARIITVAELERMPEAKLPADGRFRSLRHYHFSEPVVIRGDIAGKYINTTSSLWIDGNMTDCYIEAIPKIVDTIGKHYFKRIKKEGLSEQAQTEYQQQWQKAMQEAAQEGMGLFIKGNVANCIRCTAPNIAIIGNVIAGVTQEDDLPDHIIKDGMAFYVDKDPWPNNLWANGGHLHIDGNVTGRDRELDGITASDNVRISGNAKNYKLTSDTGVVTIGGEKSGVSISGKERGKYIAPSASTEQRNV